MRGAVFYHFSNKLILFLTILSQANFSMGKTHIDVGSNYEFGLQPTSSPQKNKKNKSILPMCHDIEHLESAPGVKANRGYCIGNIAPEDPRAKKHEIILFGEYLDKDGELIRIIQRNPVLMSIAQFLNICRPLNGKMDSDGLYCKYVVKF